MLTTLRCGSNPGMVGELYSSGNLKTPDVHIEALQELLNALKPSGVTELDISAIGIGPKGADHVADYVRDARAVLASVTLSDNAIDEESRSALQESVSSRQPTIELIWDK